MKKLKGEEPLRLPTGSWTVIVWSTSCRRFRQGVRHVLECRDPSWYAYSNNDVGAHAPRDAKTLRGLMES